MEGAAGDFIRSHETTRRIQGSLTAGAHATNQAVVENPIIKQLYDGLAFNKLLLFAVLWTLAIVPQRFGSPWDSVSFASGFGAILVTASLTKDALKLIPSAFSASNQSTVVERGGQASGESSSGRRSGALQDIDEFFEPRFRFGGPRERNLKLSTFVLRARDWLMLQQALYDTFLKGAPPLLFEMGHQVGSSMARDLKEISPKAEVVLSYLEEFSRRAGWGIITVDGELVRGSKITLRIQESPFCVCASPSGKDMNSCHFVSGLASGILEEIYGWPYSTYEKKCIMDGESSCEIVATQRGTDVKKLKERWNLSVMFRARHPWRQA
jgi:predicted hydrocarbon binding protein